MLITFNQQENYEQTFGNDFRKNVVDQAKNDKREASSKGDKKNIFIIAAGAGM